MIRNILTCIVAVAISSALSMPMSAACHAVSASGSGSSNGTNWNNPYAGLPGKLVRGDTYYLADGGYGAYTMTTVVSGTTPITILKATPSDFGNSCGIGTGWNPATMGSSSATFTQWSDTSGSSGYYTLNGVFGSFNGTELPVYNGFGIYIDGSTCQMGSLSRCVGLDLAGANNVTATYVEDHGTGATSSANTNTPDDLIYYGGSSNVTIDHSFFHDSSCDFTFGYGSTEPYRPVFLFLFELGSWFLSRSSVLERQLFKWNCLALQHHADHRRQRDLDNRNGGRRNDTLSNWEIYGNTIYFGGTGDKSTYQCLGDGVFACLNSGVTCTNIQFYNNTIVGLQQSGFASCGAGAAGIYGDPASKRKQLAYTVRNNIWYGNAGSTAFGPNGTFTQDHNSFLNNTGGTATGTSNVINNSAANPFLLWTGSGNLDAHLSAESSNVNNWLSLGSTFNVDPAGTTALPLTGEPIQFASQTTQAPGPTPPSLLSATAK